MKNDPSIIFPIPLITRLSPADFFLLKFFPFFVSFLLHPSSRRFDRFSLASKKRLFDSLSVLCSTVCSGWISCPEKRTTSIRLPRSGTDHTTKYLHTLDASSFLELLIHLDVIHAHPSSPSPSRSPTHPSASLASSSARIV